MSVFQEAVCAVREVYPKFSPACLSLASRTSETGVMLTPRAKSIVVSVNGSVRLSKAVSGNRAKSISFRCRLSPKAAEIVKHEMTARGLTQQELLEGLILRWVKENRSPAATEERQDGGNNLDSVSTSENITNIQGGQHGKKDGR